MKTSLAALNLVVDSNIRGMLIALAQNNGRSILQPLTFDTFVDNSTGTVAASLAPVPTQASRVRQSGTNLASRSGFNTAIDKVNNALAVLRDAMARNAYTPMQLTPAPTGGNGTVATQGTVPALDKTVTGVDGSGGDAMLRGDMNAAIVRARNNLSAIIRMYNQIATAIGIAQLKNNTGGTATSSIALSAGLTAPNAVAAGAVAAGDLATKVAADAALTAIANDVATVFSRIRLNLFDKTGTLAARVPITLVR